MTPACFRIPALTYFLAFFVPVACALLSWPASASVICELAASGSSSAPLLTVNLYSNGYDPTSGKKTQLTKTAADNVTEIIQAMPELSWPKTIDIGLFANSKHFASFFRGVIISHDFYRSHQADTLRLKNPSTKVLIAHALGEMLFLETFTDMLPLPLQPHSEYEYSPLFQYGLYLSGGTAPDPAFDYLEEHGLVRIFETTELLKRFIGDLFTVLWSKNHDPYMATFASNDYSIEQVRAVDFSLSDRGFYKSGDIDPRRGIDYFAATKTHLADIYIDKAFADPGFAMHMFMQVRNAARELSVSFVRKQPEIKNRDLMNKKFIEMIDKRLRFFVPNTVSP